jgi:hypothetical protein
MNTEIGQQGRRSVRAGTRTPFVRNALQIFQNLFEKLLQEKRNRVVSSHFETRVIRRKGSAAKAVFKDRKKKEKSC